MLDYVFVAKNLSVYGRILLNNACVWDDDDHPFDPKSSRCAGMGVVAENFWRLSDVLRSDNPAAFAAMGPRAAEITAPHPIDPPHGLNSPVGRVFDLDGQVLLLAGTGAPGLGGSAYAALAGGGDDDPPDLDLAREVAVQAFVRAAI